MEGSLLGEIGLVTAAEVVTAFAVVIGVFFGFVQLRSGLKALLQAKRNL